MPAVGLVCMDITTQSPLTQVDDPKVPVTKGSGQRGGSGEDLLVAGHDGLFNCTGTERPGNY